MKEQFISKRFSVHNEFVIALVNNILDEYSEQGYDLSLRQLYYQLVARDKIENSVKSYKKLGKLVSDARLAGHVDWSMIVDRSRSQIINQHWDNPGQIVKAAARSFRVDKWENQPVHMEVMVEKDALSGVLLPVTERQDIYFTANKGYPSASLLYRMSKRLMYYLDLGKDVYILHLGDHDPSGMDMTRDLVDRLKLFSGYPVTIQRLALNMDQIEQYNPPENPAKLTDTRANVYIEEYGYSSWELDALEPKVLAELVDNFVNEHRDEDLWQETLGKERDMRKSLNAFADEWKEEKS